MADRDLRSLLDEIAEATSRRFHKNRGVLSLQAWLELLAQQPYSLTRDAPTYIRDVFDHFGTETVSGISGPVRRFRLFDDPGGFGSGLVYGQEPVQNRLYEVVSEFVERGRADRFVLLHGPNGSAKSSIVQAIRNGLEIYSETDEGSLYGFSWVFCESTERESLGFGASQALADVESYAHVDDRLVTSRMPDETRDSPLFLVPRGKRKELLEQLIEQASPDERERFRYKDHILLGELSPKNRVIYDALMKAYEGDWKRVIRHVRVERFTIAHRYRRGAVTIEPQGTIDASARVIGHSSMSGLPPALINESLVEAHGDLVDANGGIVEYSDFLKRNMEANKYLLSTAEHGSLSLPGLSLQLNLLLTGTTNEKFLSAFKRDPTFASFRGRFEFIRVPYLLEYKKEARIYQRHLDRVAGGRHVAPHTATAAALWAVLTRLLPPEKSRFPEDLGGVVENLSPLEKARLYDRGELPSDLSEEDRKNLRAAVPLLVAENDTREEEVEGFVDAAYEGRRGASPREIMSLLTEIAVECDSDVITPVDVFEALPRLTADPTLYGWLRLRGVRGFNNPEFFVDLVRREYLKHIAREVQKASDLVEETEYHRLFQSYVHHVRAHETHEKVENSQTGAFEAADLDLMGKVEDRLKVKGNNERFRRDLMTKIAAFRLTHPEKPLVLKDLFADHYQALERSFFDERRERIMTIVQDALEVHSGGGQKLMRERQDAAKTLLDRMVREFGYNKQSVGQVLAYFRAHRDELDQ